MDRVELKTGGEYVRQNMSIDVRDIDEEKKTCKYLLSPSKTVDRHDTIFLASAWENRLDAFLANPCFIWNHEIWTGTPLHLLGNCDEVWVEPEEGLLIVVRYAVEQNPWARMCWELVRGGFLRAVSHRFRAYSWVCDHYPDDVKSGLPDYAKAALEGGDCYAVFTDVELLEASQVLVGSNREALKRALQEGAIDPELCVRALGAASLEELQRPAGDKRSELERPNRLITVNEARTALGFEPLPTGNVLLVPSRFIEAAADADLQVVDEIREAPGQAELVEALTSLRGSVEALTVRLTDNEPDTPATEEERQAEPVAETEAPAAEPDTEARQESQMAFTADDVQRHVQRLLNPDPPPAEESLLSCTAEELQRYLTPSAE